MIGQEHHDAHAKAGWHVISQMLQWPEHTPDLSGLLADDDFYLFQQRQVFTDLVANPQATVTELARSAQVPIETVENWKIGPQRVLKRATVDHYANSLRQFAVDRRTAMALQEVLGEVGKVGSELSVPEILHRVLDDYAGAAPSAPLTTFADVIAEEPPPRDWIFEGMLATGWTMVLVGAEGAGKSTLLRQLAFCAAAGLANPFSFADKYLVPRRTLVVDVENLFEELHREWSDLARREWPRSTRAENNVERALQAETLFIERPPFGLDITSAKGFATLHGYCRQIRPELLCIGPLYFLQPKAGGRSDEEVAIEVVSQLQRIRDEFGCAIAMETHAPKGGGGHRDIVSFGSSVYLRWPGIQFGMVEDPDEPGAYALVRNRGHRYSDAVWPDKLYRADKGTDHRYWSLSRGSRMKR